MNDKKLGATTNPQKTTTEKTTIVDRSRRKAMTGMVVGGAALGVWHKPAIKSVFLPAHAQTSSDMDADFFATVADASVVTTNTQLLLDTLIEPAYAILVTNEEAVSELKFEAEAISQGGGTYQLKIAADHIPANGRVSPSSTNFIFGWEGTISGLNSNASLTGTGCAQNETGLITSVSNTGLTLEMSYFSKTIQLVLDAGSANLPSFPLSCVNS